MQVEKSARLCEIVNVLKRYGIVLTEHIADLNFTRQGETNLSMEEIYQRDKNWLDECDIIFSDITISSLGVGYEMAYGESKGKPIVCMYEEDKNVSGMIRGNHNFTHISYHTIEHLLIEIQKILENNK